MVRTLAVRAALLAIGALVVPVLANAAPVHARPVTGSAPLSAVHSNNGFMSPEAAGKNGAALFVSDAEGNAVYVFNPKHVDAGPIGEITAGIDSPAGLAVDGNGVLYVANTNSSAITEYKPGATAPFATLTGFTNPQSVAVNSKGTLVVTSGTTYDSPGMLAVYAPGSSTPERTITIPLSGYYYVVMGGVAIDRQGNIFLSFAREYPGTQYQIVEFKAGSTTPVSTGIAGEATGLAVDGKGNLYVGYQSSIEVFAKGSKQPQTTITSTLNEIGLFSVSSMGNLYVPNQWTQDGCQLEDGSLVTFSRSYQANGQESSGLIDPYGTAFRSGSH